MPVFMHDVYKYKIDFIRFFFISKSRQDHNHYIKVLKNQFRITPSSINNFE